MATKLYGIPNCDTVKKARAWLDAHKIAYSFHDFKKDGLSAEQLDDWLLQLDWEVLLNRRGMLWRKLTDAERDTINAINARALMLKMPSIIKRPVLAQGKTLHVGFNEADYAKLFKV